MTKQLTRSAVRIYGALSGLGNGTGDILEGLIPFFDPILRRFNGTKLEPDLIAAAIRETYKWNFNSDLVETFVAPLVRQGWLIADIPLSGNATTYTINVSDSGGPDASASKVEAELRAIAENFKAFSEALSPLTTLPREVEEFEDILVEWLLYNEMFTDKSIETKVSTTTDPTGTIRRVTEYANITSLRDEDRYLCARFVSAALKKNDGTAEILAKIAAIGLLTEVVQDFLKPVSHIDTSDLVVYLDAPVAMELLGVSGNSAKDNISPVVAELTRIGASVRIFGQSIDEIKRTLQTVLTNVRPYGPTADALRRQEVLRDYVVSISRDPASFLDQLGVRATYRTLTQNPNEHRHFTSANRQELYSRLHYLPTVEARDHDCDITTLAVRQRGGRASPDIFRSGCIVLTRNGTLAQTVKRTCIELGLLPSGMVPPIVHRRVLATAMWLRTGMGAGDLNIPKRMLLASCEQVLAIRPNVVDSVRKLTEALGDESKSQQLELLITQDRSVSALMDKTLGSSSVVTSANLSILWEEMIHPHLEGVRQQGAEVLKAEQEKAKKKLEKAKAELVQTRQLGEAKESALAAELKAKLAEDLSIIEALCGEVDAVLKKSRKIRIGIGAILALLSWIPSWLSPSTVSFSLSGLTTVIFAYLTATGGKIIGVDINQEKALLLLQHTAKTRRLESKLVQFDVLWTGKSFMVSTKAALSQGMEKHPTDLFGGPK